MCVAAAAAFANGGLSSPNSASYAMNGLGSPSSISHPGSSPTLPSHLSTMPGEPLVFLLPTLFDEACQNSCHDSVSLTKV